MRPILSLCVLAAAGLAGCTGAHEVASTPPTYHPPTVSYSVPSGDLSDANMRAANYCARYSGTARLVSSVGGQATYQCVGGTATGPVVNQPTVVTPAPVVTAPVVTPAPVIGQAGPSVSYPAPGNDITSANSQAASYCRQFGRAARFDRIESGTAYYTCL